MVNLLKKKKEGLKLAGGKVQVKESEPKKELKLVVSGKEGFGKEGKAPAISISSVSPPKKVADLI